MSSAAISMGNRYASISVENFGPIAEGEIHLRPLTVFSGSSNTGKSWFAALVYALFNAPDTEDFWSNEVYEIASDPSISFPEKPNLWAEELQKGNHVGFSESERQILKKVIESGFRKSRQKNILRCFGQNTPGLVRRGADSGFRIQISCPFGKNSHEWRYNLISRTPKNEKNWDCTVDLPEDAGLSSDSKRLLGLILDNDMELKKEINKRNKKFQNYATRGILMEALRSLHLGFESNAWYLPSDRGGIMHAHQVVVGALIQNASQYGLNSNNSITPLSGILADFLNHLIRFAGNRGPQSKSEVDFFRGDSVTRGDKISDDLVKNLENEIIAGQVNIENADVNYPKFVWIPRGWNAPLELVHASSMVAELVPLALFLRYNLRKGDVLILEEPEAHLHPELQVEIVRHAADWARKGIRVILTTHSEWVLDELSNLVAEAGVGAGNGLTPDDFGLWRFADNNKRNGSVIEELRWKLDEGGYDPGYMNVAAKQHRRWAKYAGDLQ